MLTDSVEVLYHSPPGERWWAFRTPEYEALPAETLAVKVNAYVITDCDTTDVGSVYYGDILVGDSYSGWANPETGGRWDVPIIVGRNQRYLAAGMVSYDVAARGS